jgi:Tfp pilus assembly protein PilF
LDPKNTTALVSLGTAQTLQKNFAEAEKSFQDALAANPKDKTALVSLANYYRAVKDIGKAEAAYRNALSIYPGDRDIYPQVAVFFAQSGKFDESEKIFRNAQTLNPKDPMPSLLLADLFIFRRQTAELQTLFDAMKKSFPTIWMLRRKSQ